MADCSTVSAVHCALVILVGQVLFSVILYIEVSDLVVSFKVDSCQCLALFGVGERGGKLGPLISDSLVGIAEYCTQTSSRVEGLGIQFRDEDAEAERGFWVLGPHAVLARHSYC